MFGKILIANRGEIAVRIIRACREMGIRTVAVYSEADKDALHTQLADEAVCIGKAASTDSYLNMERILSATIATKAEAIHPGFGFLSENSRFVEMCEKCNVAFIGPSAEVISRMGNKSEAKNTMRKAKVPVVPGTKEPVYTVAQAQEAVKEIGFPVMIKASAGGGGKGMRVARDEKEFGKLFETAQQESIHSFSDNTMYLERFVENPRPSNPNPAIVEVTVRARGSVIRVAEHGADMYAAIDLAAEKVTRQLRKFKTRVVDNRQQGLSAAEVAPVEPVADLADLLLPEDEDDQLVRVKEVELTPMTEEEALVQTDLIGHDFYVFENSVTGLVNVVYHRKNGGYGIIKPKIEVEGE